MSDQHAANPGLEEHEEAHGHDEPWLVSYADMMTLLFGFFVLMYTFASKDSEDFVKIRKELVKHFGGEYVSEPERIAKDVKKILEKSSLASGFDVIELDNGIQVNLQSGVLFQSGSAELVEQSKAPIREVIDYFKKVKNEVMVEVEGHTDNAPIKNIKFPTNWELSGGRAATVIRMFLEREFPGPQVKGMMFADQKPLVPNEDENGEPIPENRSRNRRIVLRFLDKGMVAK